MVSITQEDFTTIDSYKTIINWIRNTSLLEGIFPGSDMFTTMLYWLERFIKLLQVHFPKDDFCEIEHYFMP
jgi:hypothetical protein